MRQEIVRRVSPRARSSKSREGKSRRRSWPQTQTAPPRLTCFGRRQVRFDLRCARFALPETHLESPSHTRAGSHRHGPVFHLVWGRNSELRATSPASDRCARKPSQLLKCRCFYPQIAQISMKYFCKQSGARGVRMETVAIEKLAQLSVNRQQRSPVEKLNSLSCRDLAKPCIYQLELFRRT